jgi:hypothetical protein
MFIAFNPYVLGWFGRKQTGQKVFRKGDERENREPKRKTIMSQAQQNIPRSMKKGKKQKGSIDTAVVQSAIER